MPEFSSFKDAEDEPSPGEVESSDAEIELNAGRETVSLSVTNLGDRPRRAFRDGDSTQMSAGGETDKLAVRRPEQRTDGVFCSEQRFRFDHVQAACNCTNCRHFRNQFRIYLNYVYRNCNRSESQPDSWKQSDGRRR